MSATTNSGWLAMAGAAAMSIALVTAFSVGDTGARDVSAQVVNDANAYLALEANTNNNYQNFVTTLNNGDIAINFDGNNADASGTGINPNSTYEFNSLVNVTNQATESLSVDVSLSGTDASLCQVALTSTASQSSSDYTSNPSALSLSKDATGYLGVKVNGTAKASGSSVACSITVSA